MNEKPKPLRFHYDKFEDILTVEGIQISGDLFRVWSKSLLSNYIYRFARRVGSPTVIVEQIRPCEQCTAKFRHQGVCSICGCSESNPCRVLTEDRVFGGTTEIPCHWIETDLCSRCEPGSKQVLVRGPLSQEEIDRLTDELSDWMAEPDPADPVTELPEPRIK